MLNLIFKKNHQLQVESIRNRNLILNYNFIALQHDYDQPPPTPFQIALLPLSPCFVSVNITSFQLFSIRFMTAFNQLSHFPINLAAMLSPFHHHTHHYPSSIKIHHWQFFCHVLSLFLSLPLSAQEWHYFLPQEEHAPRKVGHGVP